MKLVRIDQLKAQNFALDVLDWESALATYLLKKTNLEKGVFYSLVPEGIKSELLYDFSCSIWMYENLEKDRADNADEHISKLIFSSIESNRSIKLIVEDSNGDLKNVDEVFKNFGFSCDSDIYYYIDFKTNKSENISKVMKWGKAGWRSLAILTSTPIIIDKEENITIEEMSSLCEGVKKIFFGAYDLESFVIWEKNNESTESQ